MDEGKDLALDSDFRIYVHNSGSVYWIPSFRWKTSCPVDLILFPFDTQECSVEFIAWLYGMENGLEFQRYTGHNGNLTTKVLLGLLSPNDQWKLTDSHVWSNNGSVNLGIDIHVLFLNFGFNLTLSRQPLYYILNILTPCMTVSVVSMFLFYLPIASGEKISFGTTMLLSYTVVLLMVNESVPRGGDSQPLLSE